MRKRQNISNLSVADGNGTLQATCTSLKCIIHCWHFPLASRNIMVASTETKLYWLFRYFGKW